MRVPCIIAIVLIGLFLVVVCIAVVTGNAPKSDYEIMLEDRDQEAYLREWKRQKEQHNARRKKH